jgi:hypothetical protein
MIQERSRKMKLRRMIAWVLVGAWVMVPVLGFADAVNVKTDNHNTITISKTSIEQKKKKRSPKKKRRPRPKPKKKAPPKKKERT